MNSHVGTCHWLIFENTHISTHYNFDMFLLPKNGYRTEGM